MIDVGSLAYFLLAVCGAFNCMPCIVFWSIYKNITTSTVPCSLIFELSALAYDTICICHTHQWSVRYTEQSDSIYHMVSYIYGVAWPIILLYRYLIGLYHHISFRPSTVVHTHFRPPYRISGYSWQIRYWYQVYAQVLCARRVKHPHISLPDGDTRVIYLCGQVSSSLEQTEYVIASMYMSYIRPNCLPFSDSISSSSFRKALME